MYNLLTKPEYRAHCAAFNHLTDVRNSGLFLLKAWNITLKICIRKETSGAAPAHLPPPPPPPIKDASSTDARIRWLNLVLTGVTFCSHLGRKVARTAARVWHTPTPIPHHKTQLGLLFRSSLGKKNWTKYHVTFFSFRNCPPNYRETDRQGTAQVLEVKEVQPPLSCHLQTLGQGCCWKQ